MSSEWPAPFQPVGSSSGPASQQPPASSPRRSRLRWLLAGGLAVGIVGVVLLIGLNACPGCFGRPTAPVGSSAPVGGVPPDIAAQIDEVIASMPDVRELAALRPVPYDLVTRDEFRAELEQLYAEEIDPAVLAAQERLFKRLGLLPATSDLHDLLIELTGGEVAAYYRTDTEVINIIERDEPFGPLDRVFVAHEFTHALQDQHFDMDAGRVTDPTEGDAALAQLAAIEGDATTAMFAWATQNLSFAELLDMYSSSLSGTDPATLDAMPLILSRQVLFPYTEGMVFETQLQQRDGWQGVDTTIRTPPPSTEQVLHPEKYDAHEAPIDVDLPDVSAQLGQGWTRTYLDTIGELNIQVLVAGDERPAAGLPGFPGGEWPHAEAAAGWGGDRLAMWEGPPERWAIGWDTRWDSRADADQFAARLTELTARFAGSKSIEWLGQDRVLVLIAADDPTLHALAAAMAD